MCEPCVKGETTVKTRGMLFKDEMVRAILANQKTQTRRIIEPQYSSPEWSVRPAQTPRHRGHTHDWWLPTGTQPNSALRACPYGVVGDRITVREAFSLLGNEDACAVDWNDNIVMDRSEAARIYRASCEQRSGDYSSATVPEVPVWRRGKKNPEYWNQNSARPSYRFGPFRSQRIPVMAVSPPHLTVGKQNSSLHPTFLLSFPSLIPFFSSP